MQYIRYIYISITVYKSLSRRKSLHVSGDNRETVVHFINNSNTVTQIQIHVSCCLRTCLHIHTPMGHLLFRPHPH